MLGTAPITIQPNASSSSPNPPLSTVVPGLPCHWLHEVLSVSDQVYLFAYVKSNDRTDWANLPPCMNPSPKTLQLGPPPSPLLSLSFDGDPSPSSVPHSCVSAVWRRLVAYGLLPPSSEPKAFTVAAIRYPSPDGTFPLHVDHCDDGSLVFLFSLGYRATS